MNFLINLYNNDHFIIFLFFILIAYFLPWLFQLDYFKDKNTERYQISIIAAFLILFKVFYDHFLINICITLAYLFVVEVIKKILKKTTVHLNERNLVVIELLVLGVFMIGFAVYTMSV